MGSTRSITSKLRSFWANTCGNTGVMYALAAVPMFLAVGAGVDFARYNQAQTELQTALDAAALAGAAGSGIADSKRETAAEKAFDGNMKSGVATDLDVSKDFDVEAGVMKAKASAKMPTSFMVLAGITEMTVEGTAEVGLMLDKNAEIVLVLDYSGSMAEVSGKKVKYEAMKEASISLVNSLTKDNPDKVKVGMVPFSHHVYTTLDNDYVQGGSKKADWTGCTQDRPYPANVSDAEPTSDNTTKWGQPFAPEHAAWGCSGYKSNKLKIAPLTDDFEAITDQLEDMKPYAWTHIALGVEFGMHLLSPTEPYTGGSSWGDTDTKKFMVVLTDGMQTEPAFGPGGVRTVAQGEENLETLCTYVKSKDVTIITLAFDLDDSGTRKRLESCASGAGNFFVAKDDTDLSLAFESIKTAIAQGIYLHK